jgi:hypothetical protein
MIRAQQMLSIFGFAENLPRAVSANLGVSRKTETRR